MCCCAAATGSAAAAAAAVGFCCWWVVSSFQCPDNFCSMATKDGPTKVLLSEDEMPKKW
jgi:hypothetical protein